MATRPFPPLAIPDDLLSLASERRIIPFLGAGFSAGLGLPSWESLLAKVAARTEGALSYDDLERYTDRNLLQIAEYLYLKSYRRIGPIRHIIEQELPAIKTPVLSPGHVELVNLGAPQIYTTNYDDLIEDTFRALHLPVHVVTLARDVALSAGEGTQVVKYHGDLRHDETLVLTESSYYKRLDFESPMDLKFRSDLLGRSVLFMGYSFRDVNIRVIWFKLMQMMKDIPQSERRPSYIVRLDHNPVLEELDQAAGLKTIVLDRDNRANADQRPNLLGQFLHQLASGASPNSKIPGRDDTMYVSMALIENLRRQSSGTPRRPTRLSTTQGTLSFSPSGFRRLSESWSAFHTRRTPSDLLEHVHGVYLDLLSFTEPPSAQEIAKICELAKEYGPSSQLTSWTAAVLLIGPSRGSLLRMDAVPWPILWGSKIGSDAAGSFLGRLENEIEFNREPSADEDIAYAVDIVSRIGQGQISDDEEAMEKADQLLKEAAELYPSVKTYRALEREKPEVGPILAEIRHRLEDLRSEGLMAPEEPDWDEEEPF